MPNPSVRPVRPHGATTDQWAAYCDMMRGRCVKLVGDAFDAVASDLKAGDRRAAAVMARFESDQSQAVDGIADALFTLLTAHIHSVLSVTIPSIPSRSQATRQQARMVREDPR